MRFSSEIALVQYIGMVTSNHDSLPYLLSVFKQELLSRIAIFVIVVEKQVLNGRGFEVPDRW